MIRDLLPAVTWVTALEGVGVLLGLAYIWLALRRDRRCWIAGGTGSEIHVFLSLRVDLPMQAALRLYYVVLAFYGWRHWSHGAHLRPVGRLALRYHLLAIAVGLALSWALAVTVGRVASAALPFLDAAVMVFSLFAAWLEARMKLEHWLYWIVIDGVLVWMLASRGLVLTSLLFATCFVLACVGYWRWRRTWRGQQAPSAAPAVA